MRAKADLVPDCDVHGEPMCLDERPAQVLALKGNRDVIFWRCTHEGCGRFFYGTVGYRGGAPEACENVPALRCKRDRAFLVAQQALGSYICPVAGCKTVADWQSSHEPLSVTGAEVESPSFSLR